MRYGRNGEDDGEEEGPDTLGLLVNEREVRSGLARQIGLGNGPRERTRENLLGRFGSEREKRF